MQCFFVRPVEFPHQALDPVAVDRIAVFFCYNNPDLSLFCLPEEYCKILSPDLSALLENLFELTFFFKCSARGKRISVIRRPVSFCLFSFCFSKPGARFSSTSFYEIRGLFSF